MIGQQAELSVLRVRRKQELRSQGEENRGEADPAGGEIHVLHISSQFGLIELISSSYDGVASSSIGMCRFLLTSH